MMCKWLYRGLWIAGLLSSSSALANWTLNLGYHNPPGASAGVNFLYWSNPWSFELGIGYVDADARKNEDSNNGNKKSDDTTSDQESADTIGAAVSGALSAKYFLSSGSIKPYLQLGIGAATNIEVGDETDASADLGGVFGGIGLMFGSPDLYVYAGLIVNQHSNSAVQAGIGFDL